MAVYMQFGTSITGGVTEEKHTGWIELSSFQWGVGRGIGSAMSGQAVARDPAIPSVSEVVVTKAMDSSSPGLWTDAVAGALDTTVKIAFTTTNGNKATRADLLTYELHKHGAQRIFAQQRRRHAKRVAELEFHQDHVDVLRDRSERRRYPHHSGLRPDPCEDDLIRVRVNFRQRPQHPLRPLFYCPSIDWAESTSITTAVMLSSDCPSSAAVTI